MKEILEMPPRYNTAVPHAGLLDVGVAEQLHPHHGEYEDDDDQDEGQVGEGPECSLHDAQDIVERFPRLRKFEHSEKSEGPQHRETFDPLCQQLHYGENHDNEIEVISFVLEQ